MELDDKHISGKEVPEGWLVEPRDALVGGPDKLTADDVRTIIEQGVDAAEDVRAAIRLKVIRQTGTPVSVPGARTRMVLAVADEAGNVLGLFRMHDSTIFSIDVAVSKARNVAYYASTAIAAIDQVDDNNNGVADVPTGTAFTNRTFRFLAEPRYAQGVDGSRQGDFSILNDPGFRNELLNSTRVKTNNGAVENDSLGPRAYTEYQSVMGFDAFNPGSNFRDPDDIANQSGIVFFPGSAPLYKSTVLVGGFGVSGDGVDQDDVVTFFGVDGFRAPSDLRADKFFVRGIRLPYQKFNRNPFA